MCSQIIVKYMTGSKMSKSKGKEKKGSCIVDQAFFEHMKSEWTEEIASSLASKILSQLQAANPHMNLVIPNFTTAAESTSQGNLQPTTHVCYFSFYELIFFDLSYSG